MVQTMENPKMATKMPTAPQVTNILAFCISAGSPWANRNFAPAIMNMITAVATKRIQIKSKTACTRARVFRGPVGLGMGANVSAKAATGNVSAKNADVAATTATNFLVLVVIIS